MKILRTNSDYERREMNFELYIAKKIICRQNFWHRKTASIINIAVASIAVSVAVMLLSIAVVIGFKNEISEKVIGFGAHISIVNFDSNNSFETVPISQNQLWLEKINKLENVHINKYIQKAGIVKADNNLAAIIFKGIDTDYQWNFFKQYLIEGNLLIINDSVSSNDVIISKKIADNLGLKVGDDFKSYFIQEPPRMRNFKIKGIYNTNLEDLDKIFVLVDIKQLRKLNNWKSDQITGFDVTIKDFSKIAACEADVKKIVGNYFTDDGALLKVKTIMDDYPAIFDWLALLDMNVWVILVLMIAVSAINMISCVLVIILERVQMIGILKSLGAKNFSVAKIFIYLATFLVGKGLLFGNIIGIGLCLLQYFTGIIRLDSSSYYVDAVPISLNLIYFLILNIATSLIISLIMIIPALFVAKIKPAETIRFD